MIPSSIKKAASRKEERTSYAAVRTPIPGITVLWPVIPQPEFSPVGSAPAQDTWAGLIENSHQLLREIFG